MPQKAWSAKRERQYEHVKESERKKGESPKRAKEIAARTVNKARASSGETKSSRGRSSTSRSSSSRGGSASRDGGRTKEQLYAEARRLGIDGRSKMNKGELIDALRNH